MLPLRTENPNFRAPVVTVAIIALNFAAFVATEAFGDGAHGWSALEWGCIPQRVVNGHRLTYLFHDEEGVAAVDRDARTVRMFDPDDADGPLARHLSRLDDAAFDAPISFTAPGLRTVEIELTPIEPKAPARLSVLTSMFMHGGWEHLLVNLWFLWLFGRGVEDVLGRLGYAAFYLLTGLAADLAHILSDTSSLLPSVGASGAISGVMGGYLLLFPRGRVLAWVSPFFGGLIPLPAFLYLGLYLVEQAFMCLRDSDSHGGVAWWAHLGGFAAGMAVVRLFPASPEWTRILQRRKLSRDRFGYDYTDVESEAPHWSDSSWRSHGRRR